jgi:hypothetical protein
VRSYPTFVEDLPVTKAALEFAADKLAHYWACLALLEERIGHVPLVRQLRFELEALALLPPAFTGS